MTPQEEEMWLKLDGKELSSGHVLRLGRYGNGRGALEAICHDGIPECKVTVNMIDEDLGEGEFHVRLETSHKMAPNVFDALIKDGIAEPTHKIISAGYVKEYAEVWRLK